MNQYQFERIVRDMAKEFGKIQKGRERHYEDDLCVIECNALYVHRRNPEADSRKMRKAILLALHDIDGRLRGVVKDLSEFEDDASLDLKHVILTAFDPFFNEELGKKLMERGVIDIETATHGELKQYYKIPIMCMLRIADSVETWMKNSGSNGYFLLLEDYVGYQVDRMTKNS